MYDSKHLHVYMHNILCGHFAKPGYLCIADGLHFHHVVKVAMHILVNREQKFSPSENFHE